MGWQVKWLRCDCEGFVIVYLLISTAILGNGCDFYMIINCVFVMVYDNYYQL